MSYHGPLAKSTLFCEKNFVREQGTERHVLRCEKGGHWAWSWTISACGFSILDTRFWMLVWGSLFGRQRRLPYWILNSGPYFSHHTLMATDHGQLTKSQLQSACCPMSSNPHLAIQSCLLSTGLNLFEYFVRCRQCLIDILLIMGQTDKGSLKLGRSQIHTPL